VTDSSSPARDVTVEGTLDDRFSGVRDALAANLASGADCGASVAVYLDGEPVVDIWGGFVDEARSRPWRSDTIVNVWSTTKTMAALCALVLADRGELDLHAPVARYWPEFAAAGKEAIEVRHLLSHTAGLSGWDEPLVMDDLLDWERCTSLLAAQAPWWVPGTMSGYHAVTQGYLVGEVVRRVAGQSLGRFFAEQIAGPLGADFHIGTGPAHDGRIAHVIPPPTALSAAEADADSIAVRTLANPILHASTSATVPWRRAEIPAAGGHGNARSVARIHSAVACGGEVDGIRLMSQAGCERIFEEQVYGQDLVLPMVARLGMGFGLNCPEVPISPNPRACFWGGWGGSLAVIDLDARVSFAYVMNRMGEGTVGDMRAGSLLLATYASLGASMQP
jgi:CubicO group peptidase (beta-lactamase class C family)